MAKFRFFKWLLLSVLIVFIGSGCVYYNTFFNARKKFNEAEGIRKKSQQGQQSPRGINQPQGGRAGSGQQTGGQTAGRAGSSASPSLVTPQAKMLYEDAISKASKVLKFHPESKYIDDALWLIGKSYFSMGDYILADRKFQELVINHPNSKYADDSYFYSGLCQVELGNEDPAQKAFAKIESMFKKSEYIDDVYFAKGNIDMKVEDYAAAMDQFNLYLEKFPGGDSAAKAVFLVGQCREKMGEYYDAYLTYSRVERHKPDRELYFDAALASAVAALKADSLNIGMKILQELAQNERYFSHSAKIRLNIAEGYTRQGEIEKAIEEYSGITVQNPRTNESAEAYYRLGLIYQDNLFDMVKAKESFGKAQNENPSSEFKNLALNKSAQIAKLESYQIELQRADSLRLADLGLTPDSVAADTLPGADSLLVEFPSEIIGESDEIGGKEDSLTPPDSAAAVIFPGPEAGESGSGEFIGPLQDSTIVSSDSTLRENIPDSLLAGIAPETILVNEDSLKAVEAARRDSLRQEIIRSGIETRFLLAELYAYELSRPDSAINEYLMIIREHPESPYAVKALLAAANIDFSRHDTLDGNSYLRRVIDEYPRSPQAVQAAETLKYPLDLSDNSIGLYVRAESLIYYENDPDSAITIFRHIEENFPDLAAKASFAIAWTLDNVKNVTDSSAYYAYTAVNGGYPNTEYAAAAKLKLGMVTRSGGERQMDRNREKEIQGKPEAPAMDPDSLRKIASGLPNAPPVLKLGEFLYPEELLSENLKGEVMFKIKLDITGRVQDYEIIGPSGQKAIDSVATAALLETEFDTSQMDFAQLESFFKYSIPFERPDIDIFNDPYKDRREKEGY